jgi:hypothetical protein
MVREIAISAFVIVVSVTSLHSQAASWNSLGGGYAYSNTRNTSSGVESVQSTNSIIAVFDSASFSGSIPVGFWISDTVSFPISGLATINGLTSVVDFSAYKLAFGVSLSLGPVVLLPLSGTVMLQLALGPSVRELALGTQYVAIVDISLGLRLVASLMILFGDNWFARVGTEFGYDFADYTMVFTHGTSTGNWLGQYLDFRIAPSVSIGFRVPAKPKT